MNTFLDNNLVVTLAIMASLILLLIIVSVLLLLMLRRVHRDQKVVIGDGEPRDLVKHARAVQERVDQLAAHIEKLEEKIAFSSRRLDDCLTFRSVTRYDAYRDLSGMQSTSVALLDTRFSGMIISSIQGRDHARIYVKEIFSGESKEKLAPEEIQVLKEAMGLVVKQESVEIGGGGDA
jgi:competence protein ComGC